MKELEKIRKQKKRVVNNIETQLEIIETLEDSLYDARGVLETLQNEYQELAQRELDKLVEIK